MKHKNGIMRLSVFFGVLITVLHSSAIAQVMAGYQSFIYPHSVRATGMGEQGITLADPLLALQYNPANLLFARGIEVSYFRNPWNLSSRTVPLSSIAVALNIAKVGYFGLEYTNHDFGECVFSTIDSPEGIGSYHLYERSVAIGYARPIDDEWAIGMIARLGYYPNPPYESSDHLFIGVGTTYTPSVFEHRYVFAMSLLNCSSTIDNKIQVTSQERVVSSAPPTVFHLGIGGPLISDEAFRLGFHLGGTKPFVKYDEYPKYEPHSSFSAIVSDWSDFPEDMTAQIGLSFIWTPLLLTSDMALYEEMYAGYFTVGPKEHYNCFFTHGARIGFDIRGLRTSIGYAGRWHNGNIGNYLPWTFPWEVFDFRIVTDLPYSHTENDDSPGGSHPVQTIIRAGYASTTGFGRMKKSDTFSSLSSEAAWSISSDFYLNDRFALLTSLEYSKLTGLGEASAIWWISSSSYFNPTRANETISLGSGVRYHPFERRAPLFIQGLIGIIRLNPVEKTIPRYYYKSYTAFGTGAVLRLYNTGIVLIPSIDLKTIFMTDHWYSTTLVGFNQIELGLSVGYAVD